MLRMVCLTMTLAVLLGGAGAAWAQGDYLDVLVVKVEPEKRAAFDAAAKKLADANRRNHGDNWIAMETVYGEQNTVTMISTRRNYADVDKGYELFYGAMTQAYGQPGMTKILQDFSAATEGLRGEIRRRRLDLSANVPTDPAASMKLVGESRWIRTTIVHVRPGQALRFEEQVRAVKEAAEKSNPGWSNVVFQAVAGQKGNVYYITFLAKALGDFDSLPVLPQILGAEEYKKFMATSAETLESSETIINHFVPEISNPPEGVVSASPDFWKPKPAAVKPKAAAPSKEEAKEKK